MPSPPDDLNIRYETFAKISIRFHLIRTLYLTGRLLSLAICPVTSLVNLEREFLVLIPPQRRRQTMSGEVLRKEMELDSMHSPTNQGVAITTSIPNNKKGKEGPAVTRLK